MRIPTGSRPLETGSGLSITQPDHEAMEQDGF